MRTEKSETERDEKMLKEMMAKAGEVPLEPESVNISQLLTFKGTHRTRP